MAARRQQPRPAWRKLDGLMLLDKPAGISSNQALQQVRRLYAAEKGGHTGSLDPLATGLLPLCFGEATKIAGLLLGSGKAYETVARLGVTTDTDDADGQVLRTRQVPLLTRETVSAALLTLTGNITQRPPIYSAIKKDGIPAYRRAREGKDVEVAERQVRVDSIDLLDLDTHCLRLRIRCGSGTYVRSLVRDLGEALGCGAHVVSLRRLWVEPFLEPRMVTLEDLAAMSQDQREALLLPLEAGLHHLPAIHLDDPDTARLRQGQRLGQRTEPVGDYIVWSGTRAVGRARVDAEGFLHPERLFNPPAAAACE